MITKKRHLKTNAQLSNGIELSMIFNVSTNRYGSKLLKEVKVVDCL
jgi:hypothetical protein